MIHQHIKKFVTSLDENRFIVELFGNLAHEENKNFSDCDKLDPEWMADVWNVVFKVRTHLVGFSVHKDSKVLDVCCGQGFMGSYFEKQGACVSYCDLSIKQLKNFKRRTRARLLAQVYEADVAKLPFLDNSFDYIVGNSFLHHLPNVPLALREIYRVLKPGGRLFFSHEPSECAVFWESFPVSLFKNTACNRGLTDLWQFDPVKLCDVFYESGFAAVNIRGGGIISSILLNWMLILFNKVGMTNQYLLKPLLLARPFLTVFEMKIRMQNIVKYFPSLLVVATKP